MKIEDAILETLKISKITFYPMISGFYISTRPEYNLDSPAMYLEEGNFEVDGRQVGIMFLSSLCEMTVDSKENETIREFIENLHLDCKKLYFHSLIEGINGCTKENLDFITKDLNLEFL